MQNLCKEKSQWQFLRLDIWKDRLEHIPNAIPAFFWSPGTKLSLGLREWEGKKKNTLLYKCCSESYASYFLMSAHSVRDRYWWYGSRGWTFSPTLLHVIAMWQMAAEGQSDKMVPDTEVQTKQLIIPCRNKGTRWHSLTLAKHLWWPNSGYGQSEAVGGVFQQWSSVSVQILTCTAHRLLCIAGKNA